MNRVDAPGHLPDMQRHHLLPCQLLSTPGLAKLFGTLGRRQVGFDDFRANGLLLPASTPAAVRSGLPLHRGPHRLYNEMVATRIGQIEAQWSRRRRRDERDADVEALLRLALVQGALRRSLLRRDGGRPCLNRRDPFAADRDFAELDAMAERLWTSSSLSL